MMKVENKELIDILQEQISVEEKIINSINNAVTLCKNTAIMYLLHGLQLDSLEHIDMCKAISDMLTGTSVSYVESEDVKKILDEHLVLEKEALENIKQAVQEAPNPTIHMLLKNLALDEERHHRSIKQITGVTERMSDIEMWDMILSTFWEFI